MVSSDFRRQIEGYGLTTANILYRLPGLSRASAAIYLARIRLGPPFSRAEQISQFWVRTLDGPLFRVTVAHKTLIGPADLKAVDGEFRLN
jgi:uncharacterized protein Usg